VGGSGQQQRALAPPTDAQQRAGAWMIGSWRRVWSILLPMTTMMS
jgi:hypothetical protein